MQEGVAGDEYGDTFFAGFGVNVEHLVVTGSAIGMRCRCGDKMIRLELLLCPGVKNKIRIIDHMFQILTRINARRVGSDRNQMRFVNAEIRFHGIAYGGYHRLTPQWCDDTADKNDNISHNVLLYVQFISNILTMLFQIKCHRSRLSLMIVFIGILDHENESILYNTKIMQTSVYFLPG